MVAIETRNGSKRQRGRRGPNLCRSEQTEPKRGVRAVIRARPDIIQARQLGRELALKMGFTGSDVTRIASAISEIARNILDYAHEGEMEFQEIPPGKGLLITARDRGPGIPDVSLAMQYGYSSGTGLGVGLPGARWLMDEFNIQSVPGRGTVVTMKKWLG